MKTAKTEVERSKQIPHTFFSRGSVAQAALFIIQPVAPSWSVKTWNAHEVWNKIGIADKEESVKYGRNFRLLGLN